MYWLQGAQTWKKIGENEDAEIVQCCSGDLEKGRKNESFARDDLRAQCLTHTHIRTFFGSAKLGTLGVAAGGDLAVIQTLKTWLGD